jgi:molybdenum cofactor biosynthesis protein B
MSVYWALVITSDRVKREPERDMITPLVKDMLDRSGHSLVYRTIVGNSFAEILHGISNAMLAGADIILVTGGTGPNPRDISVDIVSRLADRELPGIGEEFRRRSIARKVKNAVMSRASAYIVDGRLVVVSPGNPDAVETMMGLLLDVADHLVEQLHGKKHH